MPEDEETTMEPRYEYERPPRWRRFLTSRACCVVSVCLLLLVIYVVSIGATAGSFYAIGKAVTENHFACNCPKPPQCPLSPDQPPIYTLEDYENGRPWTDLRNIFTEGLTEEDLQKITPWPEGVYHPLLSKKNSPEWVYHYSTDYPLDRNDPTQRSVMQTNEYQIALNTDLFANRTEGVEVLQRIVTQYLGKYISSLEEPEQLIWNEVQYEPGGCGVPFSELRVRNYLNGKHANSSALDVNKDVKQVIDAVSTTYLPPVEHIKHYEMKLEQDIHVCRNKFNRKLKLKKVPFGTELDCQSCKHYFPNTFYDEDLWDKNPLRVHSDKHWWILEQKGYLFGNSTQFKATFSLAYTDYNDLMTGRKPHHDTEWSIRIYSLDDGYGPWDAYVLAVMGDFFGFMMDNYGSTDANLCEK